MGTNIDKTQQNRSRSVLLPVRIDEYAEVSPSKTFVCLQRSANSLDGSTDLSYAEFARAIDRAAWWLHEHLECPGHLSSLAYFGPADLRCLILIVAAAKTEHQMLFCHTTLTIVTRVRLLERAGCRAILCANTTEAKALTQSVRQQRPEINELQVPDLENWLSTGDGKPYLYEKSWEDAADDAVVSFNTSGTTGDPKPITYRHRTIAMFDTHYRLQGDDLPLLIHTWKDRKVFNSFPFFHMGGVCLGLFFPVYFHSIPVLPWPYAPVTPESVSCLFQSTQVSGAILSPSLLEDMARDHQHRRTLAKLDTLQFGSAPLNTVLADTIRGDVRDFQTIYGSTEMLFPPFSLSGGSDWGYNNFHPCNGFQFEPRAAGVYELVANRRDELEEYQAVFTTRPDLQRFESKDLWSPHPTRPGLWKYEGRTDDLLFLSGGYRLFTASREQEIQEHPLVRSALIGGKNRAQPFLLVEMVKKVHNEQNVQDEWGQPGDNKTNLLLDKIWPAVLKANEVLPEQIWLRRGLTVVTDLQRPFVRTLKGSVDRKRTIELYAKEIEDRYKGVHTE